MTQLVRFAVVGTGHLGSIHARLLSQNSDVALAAVIDPNESAGRSVADSYGATWFPSLDLVQDVDAVVIAAPTTAHHAIACMCIERGLHCFIEKPITATLAEAEDLVARAEASNLVVQVGHVERFNPAVRSLSGYSIDPVFMEVHRLAAFKPRAIDVSVIHDLMIHDIDLLMWLTRSNVVDIQATGVSVLTDTTDICNARLTFANGCVANLTASRISVKPLRKLRVFQRDSYVSLDLALGTVEMFRLIDMASIEPGHQTPLGTISTTHGDRLIVADTPEVIPVNAIEEEQRSFITSIRSGTHAAVSVHDGANAVRIAEWIDKLIRQ